MRPADWFLVGLVVDPTPGDAFGIRSLAHRYASISELALDAATGVRQARSSGAAGAWIGDAAEVFRDKSGRLPGELTKANESYASVAAALRAWADQVDDTQAQADRGLQQAREATADLTTAEAALAGAQLTWTTLHAQQLTYQKLQQLYRVLPPPPGVTMPTSTQLTSTSRALQLSQSHVAAAERSVADARSRLEAATRLVHEAKERREAGEAMTVRAIGEAIGQAVKPASVWEAITDSAAWQTLITVATVVLTIVSIVAIFVGGPLVWALIIAATVILLADALMKAAQGQDMTMTIVLLLVGLIPGGRALTSAAKIADVFRSGSSIAHGVGLVGTHLLSVSKGAVLDLVKSLKPAALLNTAQQLRKDAIGLVAGVTSVMRSIPGAVHGASSTLRTPITFLHDVGAALSNDFKLGVKHGWSQHLITVGAKDPSAAAKLWQTGGDYFNRDPWENTIVTGGQTFEAGVGGPVSNFAFDGGTAAHMNHDLNAIAAGGQIGRSGGDATQGIPPSVREQMFSFQAAPGVHIPAAHAPVEANTQFGPGGLHETFFPNVNANLKNGQVVVISHATGLPLPPSALRFEEITNSAGTVLNTRTFVTFGPGDTMQLFGNKFDNSYRTANDAGIVHAMSLGERRPALGLTVHLTEGVHQGIDLAQRAGGAR